MFKTYSVVVFFILLLVSAQSNSQHRTGAFPLTQSQQYLNCQFVAHGVYSTLVSRFTGATEVESVNAGKSVDQMYPQKMNYELIKLFSLFYNETPLTSKVIDPLAYSVNAFKVCLENYMDRFPVSLYKIDERSAHCATRGVILGDIYKHLLKRGKQGTLDFYTGKLPDHLIPIIEDKLDYLKDINSVYAGWSTEWLHYTLMSSEALNCYDEIL